MHRNCLHLIQKLILFIKSKQRNTNGVSCTQRRVYFAFVVCLTFKWLFIYFAFGMTHSKPNDIRFNSINCRTCVSIVPIRWVLIALKPSALSFCCDVLTEIDTPKKQQQQQTYK